MTNPRIGYLTGEFPRATDTWIQRELASLRDCGVQVETFAVRRPDDSHMVGTEQRSAAAATIYVLELAKSRLLLASHLKLLVKSPKRYLATAKLAWSTKRDGIRGSLYQLFYFAEAGVLADQLRSKNVQHLHNHFGDSSCTLAMLASSLANVPFSFTLHGPGIFFEPNVWRLDKKIARASFVACISYFCRSQATIFAHPEHVDRLHIVHCGVDHSKLTAVSHSGEGTKLVFVARLAELKGVADLLEAVRIVAQHRRSVHLTVIGDGPDRKRFEKLAKKLKIEANVTFTGYVAQSEVAAHLQQSDVLVLPSYAEGVPVTLMEALATQVPVIATQVGGVSELVEDAVNGFIVRPGDVTQLAYRIERLLSDGELRQKMGEAGRKLTEAEFSNDIEARRLRTLFTNSLAGISSAVRPSVPVET